MVRQWVRHCRTFYYLCGVNWLVDLFTQPTYVQASLILALVCAIGLALGEIKVKGVSLGVTFVFFAGIVVGHILERLGVDANWAMISFAQNFGLIIFVYSLGLQVGPGFFSSLKKGGIKLNMIGFAVLALTTVTAIIVYLVAGFTFPDTMGLLCGAVTNTPMLGAAQQALLDVHPEQMDAANNMATACAVAYPFGVIGVLACTVLLKMTVARREQPKLADPSGDTYVAEFHVSNPAVFGKTLHELHKFSGKHIIISRIWRDGKVMVPQSSTVISKDDHLLAVLNRTDVATFNILFGETEGTDWNRPDIDWNHIDGSSLVSKHITVTKHELNGVKIGSLNLRRTLGINITRINRAGIKLVAYPGLRLQLGDRLTVVGDAPSIAKAAEILGNEDKELNNPNLVALFVGVLLGVILGMIPIMIPGISTPVKLGIAGGPILVGILMGAYGPRFHLTTYTTRSANLMLRQMGITIYLACLGLSAGGNFFDTVLSWQGLHWIGASLVIALLPTLIVGVCAAKWGKLDFAQNAGTICAAMANPMALAYANTVTDDQEASEAYATVYPLSMFLRVITAQILMLIFI